ncbi:GntR family transcriptional regulator [Planctomonas psychrotolerans]|uniref:GntR family transcriptional regulator n=1 Tax=Planctomonas psychrotolerans TaxID=2528712 RepID=UPI00123877DD|nr:GntR family transcriptional regulator [Planctomonas psychrotolerans]
MIVLDDDDPTPPFEQIRSQVADRIRVGELAGGHRLPSVRQLAGDLRIAAGTVARAYSALEAEGLIETSRTGARVRDGVTLPPAARTAARRFVRALAAEPVDLEQALSAVRAEWHARA